MVIGETSMVFGAIETGGTKTIMGVLNREGNILQCSTIPTDKPENTLSAMIEYFSGKNIVALGISSFGPLDLNPASSTYGNITSTPKLGWQNVPLRSQLQTALHIPIGIDTDVIGAALGEITFGNANNLDIFLYVTVGTGIGGGVIAQGKPLRGFWNPSFGHMSLAPHKDDPCPQGFCSFHDGCLEGLASGSAIAKRWQMKAEILPPDHPAWEIESYYLGQMCANAILILSPQKICIGGGVMQREFLFPMIRNETLKRLGGYVQNRVILEEIDSYIVPPSLGFQSGIMGAFVLAKQALDEQTGG
jgi:fructokinase